MQDDQEEELQEYNIDPQEMMSLDSVSVESAALSKRGAKKIPENRSSWNEFAWCGNRSHTP